MWFYICVRHKLFAFLLLVMLLPLLPYVIQVEERRMHESILDNNFNCSASAAGAVSSLNANQRGEREREKKKGGKVIVGRTTLFLRCCSNLNLYSKEQEWIISSSAQYFACSVRQSFIGLAEQRSRSEETINCVSHWLQSMGKLNVPIKRQEHLLLQKRRRNIFRFIWFGWTFGFSPMVD